MCIQSDEHHSTLLCCRKRISLQITFIIAIFADHFGSHIPMERDSHTALLWITDAASMKLLKYAIYRTKRLGKLKIKIENVWCWVHIRYLWGGRAWALTMSRISSGVLSGSPCLACYEGKLSYIVPIPLTQVMYKASNSQCNTYLSLMSIARRPNTNPNLVVHWSWCHAICLPWGQIQECQWWWDLDNRHTYIRNSSKRLVANSSNDRQTTCMS